MVRQGQALFADHTDLDSLARVDVPVLIVHGTADQVIDHEASRRLHEAMPGSDLWLVEGMGHDLPRELLPALTVSILENASTARRGGERRATG